MVGTEEYVFWFDVAVDDVFGVEVLETLDDLVEECGDEGRFEATLMLLDEIEEVAFEVLEDEVDLALLLEGLLDADHVVALEHLEHLDLALDGPS